MEKNLIETVADLVMFADSEAALVGMGVARGDAAGLWGRLEPLGNLAKAKVWLSAEGDGAAKDISEDSTDIGEAPLDDLYDRFTTGDDNAQGEAAEADEVVDEEADSVGSTAPQTTGSYMADLGGKNDPRLGWGALAEGSDGTDLFAETKKVTTKTKKSATATVSKVQKQHDDVATAAKAKQDKAANVKREQKRQQELLEERKRIKKEEADKKRAEIAASASAAKAASLLDGPERKTISGKQARASANRLSQSSKPAGAGASRRDQIAKSTGRKREFVGEESFENGSKTRVGGFGSSVPSRHTPTKTVPRNALRAKAPSMLERGGGQPKWWAGLILCPICKLPETGAACRASCGGVGMQSWVPHGAATPTRKTLRKSSPKRPRAPSPERETYKLERKVAPAEDTALRGAKRKLRALSYGPKGQDPVKLFQHFDRDNSGELSLAEFKQAVRKGGHLSAASLSDHDLERLFTGKFARLFINAA
jgi:hypothetical protein